MCVSHNHYLTKSLQITLLLSGMQIVEFSASVDAFWRVIMFIRWSGTLLKSNPSWHWLYIIFFNVLHIPSGIVRTGITYLFSPLSPRVTKFLEGSAYFLGKKEKDVKHSTSAIHHGHDNRQVSNNASPNRRRLQTACPSCQIPYLIWCKSHIPNQKLIEPVGHSWSDCDDGLVTPTMNTKPSGLVDVRDLTHLHCA